MSEWDVFLSYDRTDAVTAGHLVAALEGAGLRVFLDTTDIRQFESIPDRLRAALASSRVLLACYSRSYGSRRACQEEFTTAWLAGPEHVLAVNPEPGIAHLAPRELMDMLLPGHPALKSTLPALVEAVLRRVGQVSGPIGRTDAMARWPGPARFTGRWNQLWGIHSILRGGGTAVVHGLIDIGKTALAQAYVQQFGRTYQRVLTGTGATATAGDLVVLDDVTEPPERLPAGVPVLLLTRDPRLAKLGTAVELTDLRADELELADSLRTAAEGSTGLARRLAEQFSGSTEMMLDRLHHGESPLLDPLAKRVLPAIGETWDVVRVLAAAAPVPLTRDVIADVLTAAGVSTDVTTALTALTSDGVVVAGLGEFALPAAFRLVARRDPQPARAEMLRQSVVTLLADRARSPHFAVSPRRRSKLDEEERRAAHRILNELTHRVAVRELPDGEGLLRNALTSLHTLFDRVRQIGDGVDRDALRTSTPVRPGLETLIPRLLNEILRPFLSKWHPRLDDHYDARPPGVGRKSHELGWPQQAELREELGKLQADVAEVADELAVLCR